MASNPSSTLCPVLLGGLPIKAEHQEKGTLSIMGSLEYLDECLRWCALVPAVGCVHPSSSGFESSS